MDFNFNLNFSYVSLQAAVARTMKQGYGQFCGEMDNDVIEYESTGYLILFLTQLYISRCNHIYEN